MPVRPVAISLQAVILDFGGVLWDMRWDVARGLDREQGLPRASVFETLYVFDDIVCSAEVGMAKPEPEVFRLAAGRIAVPPGGCVFVDDREDNVHAAEAVGMTAVLSRIDRGDDLRAQLARLGVAPRS